MAVVLTQFQFLSIISPGRPDEPRCFMVDEATGEELLGYDNHWPKGPHRHVRGHEELYTFTSVEVLLRDFFHAVDLIEEGKLETA